MGFQIDELIREGSDGSGFISYDTSFRIWCPTNEKFWENIAKEFKDQKRRNQERVNFLSRIMLSMSPRKAMLAFGGFLRRRVGRAVQCNTRSKQNDAKEQQGKENEGAETGDTGNQETCQDRQPIDFGRVVDLVLTNQQQVLNPCDVGGKDQQNSIELSNQNASSFEDSTNQEPPYIDCSKEDIYENVDT